MGGETLRQMPIPARHDRCPHGRASDTIAGPVATDVLPLRGSLHCLPDQLAEFAPGNKLDVILLEQLAKSIAGDEVEIALAPFSAPIGMAKGHSLHLFVGKCQMHDHVRDSGSQILYFVCVEPGPVLGSYSRLNAYRSIQHDVI